MIELTVDMFFEKTKHFGGCKISSGVCVRLFKGRSLDTEVRVELPSYRKKYRTLGS